MLPANIRRGAAIVAAYYYYKPGPLERSLVL